MTFPHPDHLHDHADESRGLVLDLQATLGRRRALRLLGGAGLGLIGLAACSSDGSSSSSSSTSAGSSGTTATSGSSPPTSGVESAAATTTAAGETAPSATTPETCAEIPDETQGPFPGDGSNGPNVLTEARVVRRDITTSFGGASGTADGTPLEVVLTVLDLDAGCAPMAGAAVYVWHCDAEGRYSIYSDGVQDANYLRGVQEADAAGQVRFTTIFPGCYQGRWPHIHFEVYADLASATSGSNSVKTSQLALPQDVCEAVYTDARYPQSTRNLGQLSLGSDNVFRDDGAVNQLATTSGDVTSGYTATLSAAL